MANNQERKDEIEDALIMWPAFGFYPSWHEKIALIVTRSARKAVRKWFDEHFPA